MKPIVKSFLYPFFKKGIVVIKKGAVIPKVRDHLTILVFIMLLILACSKKEEVGQVPKESKNQSAFKLIGFWRRGEDRIYTIYTSEEDWGAMEDYAAGKPYKTGRTTSVFFFNNRKGTPDVTKYKGSMNDVIDRIYADGDTAYWIARWDRYPSGEAIFIRYPASE
jgi:hypothetical protein